MTRKLLLSDSNATIYRIVALTLADEDVQVLWVPDGEQAIAGIESDPPDIVFADISTPRRTGYDVSAYVKERPALAHIPVVLLAGAFEPIDEARAARVRCSGVLVKPFEPAELLARVRALGSDAAVPLAPAPADETVAREPAHTWSPSAPAVEEGEPASAGDATPATEPRAVAAAGLPPPSEPTGSVDAEPGIEPEPEPRLEGVAVVSDLAPEVGALAEQTQTPHAEAVPSEARAAWFESTVAPVVEPEPLESPEAPPTLADVLAETPADVERVRAELGESLDEYFDRLDAALVRLDGALDDVETRRPAEPALDDQAGLDVPTLESVLGDVREGEPSPPVEWTAEPEAPPGTAPVEEPVESSPLNDRFAHFAPEFQPVANLPSPVPLQAPSPKAAEPMPTPAVAAPSEPLSPPPQPVVSEALIEAVADRVIERLAPILAGELIARSVATVAERLVREEIEKVRLQ